MANDIIDINVYETTETVAITVQPNLTTINVNSVTGGANLDYTPSPTNGIVSSDSGTDATIPLADSTNAGLISPSEKTKLAGIATGAEVNVNADWNSTSGDSQILNKPTIPTQISLNGQSGTVNATNTFGIIAYEFTGAGNLILPTAAGNKALFKVKNRHTANITVQFTAGQNADNTTTIILTPFQALEFISNNTNYNIF